MVGSIKHTFAPGIDLTPKQREFVIHLVRNGFTPTKAAREARYSDPAATAYDLVRVPSIQAAIRFERLRYVGSDLANIATATLRDVMTDKEAPASARVQAARTVLEMSCELGRTKSGTDQDCPLSEMSAEELTRMIDMWRDERSVLVKPSAGMNAYSDQNRIDNTTGVLI